MVRAAGLAAMLFCLPFPAQPQQPAPQPHTPQPPPAGTVLFSTQHPPPTQAPAYSSSGPLPPQAAGGHPNERPDERPKLPVTNLERSAIILTDYALDVHLVPATAREAVQARLILHNVSGRPAARIALDLSSTLRWQAISIAGASGLRPAPFTQFPVATDADHTGYAQEAVVNLANPLPADGTLVLTVFYTGTIQQTSARLELLGAAPERADRTDWDAIVPTSDAGATALRGFGNVLWYPVAAPLVLLGDGNKVFAQVERQKWLGTQASIALHLTVEYTGDPPDAALFDSQIRPLNRVSDSENELIATTRGVATADFPRQRIGLRLPSLFLTAQRAQPAAGGLLSVITPNPEAVAPYAEAAQTVAPLMEAWFGPTPIEPLLLLDHRGEPFADHGLLAGQLETDSQPAAIAPLLVEGLTHAWISSQHPWIGQGLAEFLRLLWIERTQGRKAALAALASVEDTVAFAEPAPAPAPAEQVAAGTQAGSEAGQPAQDLAPAKAEPLVSASSAVAYRLKAATVWWQLREMVGETVLQKALQTYRSDQAANPAFDRDPQAMEKTIERTSGRDLGWFFADWVYQVHGLPDLSIVEVNPRPLAAAPGHSAGYLVAVEVKNAGDAAAEVPVTVRAGSSLTASARLRIPAHATAATRLLFDGRPETVEVNDGSVPELGGHVLHTREIVAPGTP